MDPELRLDKFKGALLGTFVGDTLGMPVEGWPPRNIRKRFGRLNFMLDGRLPKGSYSDDTEMMIGLAESLIELRAVDPDHIVRTFIKNLNVDRGYGWGSYRVLQLISQGIPKEEAALQVFEGGSLGNGCAMRIAPIALFFSNRPDLLKKGALDSCRITHAHPLGMEGGYLQAYAVWLALHHPPVPLEPLRFVQELISQAESREFTDKLGRLTSLLRVGSPSEEDVVEQLGNDTTGIGSIPAALYSFLAHPESFEDSLVQAVHLGGDADTIGSMCGAVAGAYFGKSRIPDNWVTVLENKEKGRDYVEKLATDLSRISP